MPPSHKKPGSSKPKNKPPPEPVDDTPKLDWEKLEPGDVAQSVKETWYCSAVEAIRNESLDAFKGVLKAIQPVAFILHLFQQHRGDFVDIDIIKLAVVRGCKPIVDCMIVVLGEARFYEFAVWGQYSEIHIAAIWGHVSLIELFHEFHLKLQGDPKVNGTETVSDLARRYGQTNVLDYYSWCGLRSKYGRILESLLRHLKRAVPQEEPVFTADDVERYQAGCEEKLALIKTVKFGAMPSVSLLAAIGEACELRFRVKKFLPKPEDLAKMKDKKAVKGKRKK